VNSYVAATATAGANFSHRILPGRGHGFLGSADLTDANDEGGKTWDEAREFFRSHLVAGRSV
jgi:hypothetical protein